MNANSSCQNTPPSSRRIAIEVPAMSGSGPLGRSEEQSRVEVRPPDSGTQATVTALPSGAGATGGPALVLPAVLPSNSGDSTRRRSREVLKGISELAPGITSKLNLAADCALVIAASAISSAGRGSWHHTVLVACIALGVWMLGARVLRHYDAWSEGLFGELAVTSVLIMSVAVALQLLNHLPGNERFSGVERSCFSPGPRFGSCGRPSSRSARGGTRRRSRFSSSAPDLSVGSPVRTFATRASTVRSSVT